MQKLLSLIVCVAFGASGALASLETNKNAEQEVRGRALDNVLENMRGNFGGKWPPNLNEEQKRELQQNGNFKLCAVVFNGDKSKSFVVVNVKQNGGGTKQWIPAPKESEDDQDNNCVIITNFGAKVEFDWKLVPRNDPDGDILTLSAEFSSHVFFDECWCGTAPFLSDPANPNYNKIEKQCTIQNFVNEGVTDKFFCMKCEGGLCKKADKDRNKIGSPDPIYQNWRFYTETKGSLGGPGLALFRQEINKLYPKTRTDITTCTISTMNLPLPQYDCSDLNALPGPGGDISDGPYGFGVNAKNFACGFATWFNCEEDIPELIETRPPFLQLHVADINFNLERCPEDTPSPTTPRPPTPTPTTPRKPLCPEGGACCIAKKTVKECAALPDSTQCEINPLKFRA